jgi:hypothetical protein
MSAACTWGNLLETCVRQHCEYEYKTVIYETGSIPSSANQAMSPDGIGIVKVNNNGQIENRIVLFEYKVAFMRTIIPGQMPNYYIPQVLIGLETLAICDFAIFVETTIRRCPLNTPGSNKFHECTFPFKAPNVVFPTFEVPICWGAIAFLKTGQEIKGNGSGAFQLILQEFGCNGLIDFGAAPKEIMEYLFESIAEGFIVPHYIYQQHPEGYTEEDSKCDLYSKVDLINMTASMTPIGLMRWKMIQKNEKFIKGRPFIHAAERYATVVNECVRQCDLMDDIMAKINKISETEKVLKQMAANDEEIKILEDFATVKEKKDAHVSRNKIYQKKLK